MVFAVGFSVLIVGCGSPERGTTAEPGGDRQEYAFSGTVLESPDHGPELCLGGVAESYPPQCSGLPVAGWDWEDVEDRRSSAGTTWAEVSVRGTYDGERFTLTAPPGPPRPDRGPDDTDFTPACEAPEARDPDAEWSSVPQDEIPRRVATWVTHDATEGWDGPFVLNVVVQPGFGEEAEAVVRRHWEGHLCVVERDQPLARELEAVQERLPDVLEDLVGRPPWVAYADERRGVVVAQVTVVDEEVQEALDEEFGPGLVELRGRLEPVE